MKIGILGGTFNPVHVGHLTMARGAQAVLGLERILWIPAKIPPHKQTVEGGVSAEDRCRMVALAVAGIPAFQLSRIEMDRDGPSYTIETLRQLRREQPAVAWSFLMGSDALPTFAQWRAVEELLTLATFVVVPRPSAPITSLPSGARRLEIPTVEVSASEIRRRVGAGEGIEALVPDAVRQYILARQLYR